MLLCQDRHDSTNGSKSEGHSGGVSGWSSKRTAGGLWSRIMFLRRYVPVFSRLRLPAAASSTTTSKRTFLHYFSPPPSEPAPLEKKAAALFDHKRKKDAAKSIQPKKSDGGGGGNSDNRYEWNIKKTFAVAGGNFFLYLWQELARQFAILKCSPCAIDSFFSFFFCTQFYIARHFCSYKIILTWRIDSVSLYPRNLVSDVFFWHFFFCLCICVCLCVHVCARQQHTTICGVPFYFGFQFKFRFLSQPFILGLFVVTATRFLSLS